MILEPWRASIRAMSEDDELPPNDYPSEEWPEDWPKEFWDDDTWLKDWEHPAFHEHLSKLRSPGTYRYIPTSMIVRYIALLSVDQRGNPVNAEVEEALQELAHELDRRVPVPRK